MNYFQLSALLVVKAGAYHKGKSLAYQINVRFDKEKHSCLLVRSISDKKEL